MVDVHPRPIFPVGTRVTHPEYGVGTVVPPWSATYCVVDFDQPPSRASSRVEFVGAPPDELRAAKWGAEITCDMAQPDWLRIDDRILTRYADRIGGWDETSEGDLPHTYCWQGDKNRGICPIVVFRLRADHPYYVATTAGFNYWPGGENAPDDWDGGTVLLGDRSQYTPPIGWWHQSPQIDRNVIGYRKRDPLDVTVARTPVPTPQQRETATLVAENDRLTKWVDDLLTDKRHLVEVIRELRRTNVYDRLTGRGAGVEARP